MAPLVYRLKFTITLGLVMLSAMWYAIALGRQAAWLPRLETWECVGNPPPIPMGWFEPIVATGFSDWVVYFATPLFLATPIIYRAHFRKTLLFWVPLFGIHLVNRWFALKSSIIPWGFCGIKDNGIGDADLVDFLIVLVALLGGLIFYTWQRVALYLEPSRAKPRSIRR